MYLTAGYSDHSQEESVLSFKVSIYLRMSVVYKTPIHSLK